MSPDLAVETWSTASPLEVVLEVPIRGNAANLPAVRRALARP